MAEKMSILDKLASALGRRDEIPNVDLAKQIAAKNDKTGVKELVAGLSDKSKDIQHDCIKVLYEVAYLKPALISPYSKEFLSLLDSTNNRMQWGAMIALSSIVREETKSMYKALTKIIEVADKGSVITKDHCYKIMCGLCEEIEQASKEDSLDTAHTLLEDAEREFERVRHALARELTPCST
jgi:hypothetical protein